MQRHLVRVQCQHVVAFAVTNPLRNSGLTAYGIECDRAVAQVKQVKPLGMTVISCDWSSTACCASVQCYDAIALQGRLATL